MKNLLLLLVFIPSAAFAADRFNNTTMFPSIGGGLLDDSGSTANTCVNGQKASMKLAQPDITYRLYTSRSSSGFNIVHAEMNAVLRRVDLKTPTAGLDKKVSASRFKEICGEKYVAADLYGARQSFGMLIDDEEARKVPTIELVEYDGTSRAAEFAALANEVVEKTLGRKASWPMVESSGPLGQSDEYDIGHSLDQYRDLAIKSPDKIGVIQGESMSYPPELILKMVK